jgi:hypothetical protein
LFQADEGIDHMDIDTHASLTAALSDKVKEENGEASKKKMATFK